MTHQPQHAAHAASLETLVFYATQHVFRHYSHKKTSTDIGQDPNVTSVVIESYTQHAVALHRELQHCVCLTEDRPLVIRYALYQLVRKVFWRPWLVRPHDVHYCLFHLQPNCQVCVHVQYDTTTTYPWMALLQEFTNKVQLCMDTVEPGEFLGALWALQKLAILEACLYKRVTSAAQLQSVFDMQRSVPDAVQGHEAYVQYMDRCVDMEHRLTTASDMSALCADWIELRQEDPIVLQDCLLWLLQRIVDTLPPPRLVVALQAWSTPPRDPYDPPL